MKFTLPFSAISILMLTSCATTMTPQQHNLFAQDYALLRMCSEQGFLNQNLAANGLSLYRNRLNRYKADTNLIDTQVSQYYEQRNSLNSNICNQYAVNLQADLIGEQQRAKSVADFNNALTDFSDSMQKNTEATRKSMDTYNARPKNSSCYSDNLGGVRCYTY